MLPLCCFLQGFCYTTITNNLSRGRTVNWGWSVRTLTFQNSFLFFKGLHQTNSLYDSSTIYLLQLFTTLRMGEKQGLWAKPLKAELID